MHHSYCMFSFSCNKNSLCVVLCMFCVEFQTGLSLCWLYFILRQSCFCQTQDGASPVNAASWNGHTEVVDLLVQGGADINLATTDEVHVSTHTVLSLIAAIVETNVKLIEFVVYDLHSHWPHPQGSKYALLDEFLGWMAQSLICSMVYCLGISFVICVLMAFLCTCISLSLSLCLSVSLSH